MSAVLTDANLLRCPASSERQSLVTRRARLHLLGLLAAGIVTVAVNIPSPLAPHSTGGMAPPAVLANLSGSQPGSPLGRAEWQEFTRRFVEPEGRVVDTGNGGVSHSKGQGYALLLAVAYDSEALFHTILAWTLAHLSRPDDALLAHRFVPHLATQDRTHRNNASDGDLLVAWALYRAAQRWQSQEHLALARRMARDFLRLNTVEVDGRLLIRPGANGFARGEHVVVNPFYALFPALRELDLLLPDPRWAALDAGMQGVIEHASFGVARLVPDWLEMPRHGGRSRMASDWPARFSWDAVRVPLYTSWAGRHQDPVLDPMMALWFGQSTGAPPPAWVDLETNLRAPYAATPGIVAVGRLLLGLRRGETSMAAMRFPSVSTAADYYNAAMIMLSIRAFEERSATPAVGSD